MRAGSSSLRGPGTTTFERDLQRMLESRAPAAAPATLRSAIPAIVADRAGVRARIRRAFRPGYAQGRSSRRASFGALGLAVGVVVLIAVTVSVRNAPGPGNDVTDVPIRAASGPSTSPRVTPSVVPTPGVILGGATCRAVGPVLPWRERPDPLDPGQPLADAGLHGMPASQAAHLLEANNYCYTFRISSQTWCVPPNGTVRDLAYGPAGELIVWVRPYPMKTFDPKELPPPGCPT